jgi:hypothetical protein
MRTIKKTHKRTKKETMIQGPRMKNIMLFGLIIFLFFPALTAIPSQPSPTPTATPPPLP